VAFDEDVSRLGRMSCGHLPQGGACEGCQAMPHSARGPGGPRSVRFQTLEHAALAREEEGRGGGGKGGLEDDQLSRASSRSPKRS